MTAQDLIVLLLVAAAGAYLARVAWQSIARRRASACGGCSTCPAGAQEEPVVQVTIGHLAGSAPHEPGSHDGPSAD